MFVLPWHVTIDSKLRVCHYKIVNGLVPTSVWLKRIGKRDTKESTFCKIADETLNHLLFTCHYVTQFWINVKQLFHTINFPMSITLYEAMYGIIPSNTFDTKISNFVLLMGKHFILQCKYTSVIPNISRFSQSLRHYYAAEEYISKRNKSYIVHCQKWDRIAQCIDIP